MDQFGRYTFRQALSALLLILLSLTAVVWLGTALKQLKLMTAQGQDMWMFIRITLLALPNLMTLIAPVALLIAVIHTLNRLNTDSELIVMTASGATSWRLGRPLMVLALVMSVWTVVMNLYVMPWSLRTLKAYITDVRTDLVSQVLQPGRFASPEPNLTFHIKARQLNGDLNGLLMHDNRDPKQQLTYLADRGSIVKSAEGTYMVMFDGHIIRKSATEDGARIIEFDRYAIDIAQMAPTGKVPTLRPRERYLSELINVPADDAYFKREPGKFRSELHERLASPLYPIAFVLIALARLGQAQTTRESRVRSVVEAFVLAAFLRLLGLAAANVVTLSAAAVPLLYVIPLAGIVGSAALIKWRMTPRRRTRLQRFIDEKSVQLRGSVAAFFKRRHGANEAAE